MNIGVKDFSEWARENLHNSLDAITPLGKGFFEITFREEEGRLATFSHGVYIFKGNLVSFLEWIFYFSPKKEEDIQSLMYPIWVQVAGLNKFLRQEECLREIVGSFGRVLKVESSESCMGRLAGPRVRTLVSNLEELPNTVILPNFEKNNDRGKEFSVLYSGLPDQCDRCRQFSHLAKNCEKKKLPPQQKIQSQKANQSGARGWEGQSKNTHYARPAFTATKEKWPKGRWTPIKEPRENEGRRWPQGRSEEEIVNTEHNEPVSLSVVELEVSERTSPQLSWVEAIRKPMEITATKNGRAGRKEHQDKAAVGTLLAEPRTTTSQGQEGEGGGTGGGKRPIERLQSSHSEEEARNQPRASVDTDQSGGILEPPIEVVKISFFFGENHEEGEEWIKVACRKHKGEGGRNEP